MVIVKMQSGLGNQMFQYAMGLATSQRIGTELKLDVTSYKHGGKRKFELDEFNISAKIASEQEIRRLTGLLGRRNGRNARLVRHICQRLGRVGHVITGPYIKPRSFAFDRKTLSLPDNIYLHGMWQSYRYFIDIDEAIRAEFKLKEVPQEDHALGLKMTDDPYSTSIHIRRGDLVTNPDDHSFVCPIEYYLRAVDFIKRKLGVVHPYIFSDEPEWAMKNLCPENATVVHLAGSDRGLRDLALMSRCRHHVTANSTFSWWGAWLSSERDGIVCTPREWFKSQFRHMFPIKDLLPASWMRL